MKTGVPWSIRGIDDDTWQAARIAARKAGLSVSEWLNELIAEHAGEAGVLSPTDDHGAFDEEDANGDHVVAAAVEKLTRRIRAMDETSRSALSGLKDRLDEIERNLGALPQMRRGTSERARSLKSVSAMVEELSRELDNADESARRMIEGLRDRAVRAGAKGAERSAGLGTVADAIHDLDQRIASMTDRIKTAPKEDGPVKLDELKNRLDALLAKGARPSSRSASLDATLRSLESRIDGAKARLAGAPLIAGEDDRMRRIQERLADISGYLGKKDPPPPMKPRPRLGDDLASAIAEISARQKILDDRSEALGSVTSLRSDIAGLTEKMTAFGRVGAEEKGAFYDLVRRIDALATERPLDRSILSAMRADLEALRATVDGDSVKTGIVERLDSLLERTPDRGRLDALGEDVFALRRALEAADSPRATARLEMRIAELARSVEAAVNGDGKARRQSETEGMARLEATLNEVAARIDGFLDRAPPSDAIAAVHDRIAGLAERLDDIDAFQRRPAAALDEIKVELAALRSEIAGRAPTRTDHLERQMVELATRLDAVTNSDADAGGLADLEAQVAHLAAEFDYAMPRTAALKHVEENLARLQTIMSENQQESIEAARLAARQAVSELTGAQGDSEILAALKADLETVRGAARPSDQSTRETLGTVHATLTGVVDRLGRLEAGEMGGAGRATGTYGAEQTMSRAEPVSAGWAIARRQGVPEDNRPLEPGSGKPDLAALREIARSASDAPREKKAGDRKADFIAAARRAAQAAAAEAAPASDAGGDAEEQRQGPFSRIGQAIRNRRRPLLLAAAAIVLALGVLQIFGNRLTEAVESAAGEEPPVSMAAPAPAPAARDGHAGIAVPKVSEPALVAPPDDGGTSLAFTEPEGFGSRFGDAPALAAGGFLPSPTKATEPAASAPQAAETQTASLDAAAPAPKHVAPKPDVGIGSAWLLNAAAAGDPAAAFEVAVRYAEGRGVQPDLAKAGEWYTRAAEGGLAVAQYRLGSLYERGQGLAKDTAAAVTWYQRAADQGNVGAMHNLAVLMSERVDGPADQAKALQWFQTAAHHGVKDSQYNLGVIYARGFGVEADMIEAYKWFAAAAAQGDTDAAGRRDDVAKLMPPDDLAKARAAAASWHPKSALPEANAVISPEGGWDEPAGKISESDRQQLVMKIQALLAGQGYGPGPPDGLAGAKTREAVRAFQKAIGATETGEISRDLVTALAGQS